MDSLDKRAKCCLKFLTLVVGIACHSGRHVDGDNCVHCSGYIAGQLSRSARARMPIATHVIEHVAAEHGMCLHPVPLRRIAPDTGASEIVYADCGATTDDKCPPCAARKRRQRMAQCRQGWHAEREPVIEPAQPSKKQKQPAALRAELGLALRSAKAHGEDFEPIESAIAQVEERLAEAGVRGSLTRRRPTKVRSTRRRPDAP